MSDQPWGMCAANGCPLFGSLGSGGDWFCFCHAGRPVGANDAITHCLRNAEAEVVELTKAIRMTGLSKLTAQRQRALEAHPRFNDLRFDRKIDIGACAWLQRLDLYLINATAEFGKQHGLSGLVPTAPIIGPTHATAHYTETDK